MNNHNRGQAAPDLLIGAWVFTGSTAITAVVVGALCGSDAVGTSAGLTTGAVFASRLINRKTLTPVGHPASWERTAGSALIVGSVSGIVAGVLGGMAGGGYVGAVCGATAAVTGGILAGLLSFKDQYEEK